MYRINYDRHICIGVSANSTIQNAIEDSRDEAIQNLLEKKELNIQNDALIGLYEKYFYRTVPYRKLKNSNFPKDFMKLLFMGYDYRIINYSLYFKKIFVMKVSISKLEISYSRKLIGNKENIISLLNDCGFFLFH